MYECVLRKIRDSCSRLRVLLIWAICLVGGSLGLVFHFRFPPMKTDFACLWDTKRHGGVEVWSRVIGSLNDSATCTLYEPDREFISRKIESDPLALPAFFAHFRSIQQRDGLHLHSGDELYAVHAADNLIEIGNTPEKRFVATLLMASMFNQLEWVAKHESDFPEEHWESICRWIRDNGPYCIYSAEHGYYIVDDSRFREKSPVPAAFQQWWHH